MKNEKILESISSTQIEVQSSSERIHKNQSNVANYDLFMSLFLNNTIGEDQSTKHFHKVTEEEDTKIIDFDTFKIDRRSRKLKPRNRYSSMPNSDDTTEMASIINDSKSKKEASSDHSISKETIKLVEKEQFETFHEDVAQDRRLLIPFSVIDVDFVEAKYQSIIIELTKQIDEARDAIIKDIVTKNMLGYTMIVAYMFGMVFDIVGFALLEYKSLGETIEKFLTEKETFGLFNWFGWYAFGFAGPWFFPAVFNGGDPNLECSSSDYLELLGKHDLTLDIHSFTELSDIQATILTERFQRDYNRRLGCIINMKSSYKEASRVFKSIQSLSFLVHLHNEIQGSNIPEGPTDVLDLDLELEFMWGDIILLTDQVYDEVTSRRAHTAVVYVFIGFLNVMGMVGVNIFYYSVIEDHFNKIKLDGGLVKDMDFKDEESSVKLEVMVQDILKWILSDGVDSHFIQSVGATIFFAAPFAWGYGYWMTYFLFVESADPGCGAVDRDDVYNR